MNNNAEDLTGRSRLLWNTIVSWLSQLAIIASGFVVPRLMDETLGQTMLGIWDLAWSLISYLNLMGLGIGSSSNRYVAKYRSEGNKQELSKVLSTVTLIQVGIGIAILLALYPMTILLESRFADRLGENLEITSSVMVLLGLSVAIEMLANSTRGVITGFHRWDVHNGVYAGAAILNLILLSGVLLAGGNLVWVSAAYLATVALSEAIRIYFTFKLLRGMELSYTAWSWGTAGEMLTFGLKTMSIVMPHIMLIQTVNLVTVATLGPAALAIYNRPFSLLRQLLALVVKFTLMLTTTASSIQSTDNKEEMLDFVRSTMRFNWAMTVPAITFFVFFGDILVAIWMGDAYRDRPLVVVLSLGMMLSIGQDGFIRIMQGLNLHGRLALYLSVSVLITAAATYYSLDLSNWSLLSSALLVTVPLTVSFGILLPIYSCHAIGMKLWEYCSKVLFRPLLWNLPLIMGFALSRYLYDLQMWQLSLVVFLGSGLLILAIYYQMLLPASMKDRFAGLVRRGSAARTKS